MESSGFFAVRLGYEMRTLGVSTSTLAGRVGTSSEHIRKLLANESLPSPRLLKVLCSTLDLNYQAMANKVRADRVIRRGGHTVWALLGRNPELSVLYYYWDLLRPEQKAAMQILARHFGSQARKRRGIMHITWGQNFAAEVCRTVVTGSVDIVKLVGEGILSPSQQLTSILASRWF